MHGAKPRPIVKVRLSRAEEVSSELGCFGLYCLNPGLDLVELEASAAVI
jgi:hypothetical protein